MKLHSTRMKSIFCGLALLSTITAPALAGSGGLGISDATLRVTIVSRPAAGYFTLKNSSSETRILVGASSPACKKAMLPAGELEIAAGGTLTFAPGGYHVMCMKPAVDIKSRDSVPVTLKFRNGETLEAMFSVVEK